MSLNRVRCRPATGSAVSRPCHPLGALATVGAPSPQELYPYVAQLVLGDAGAIWLQPGECRDEVTACFERALSLTRRRILWSWDDERQCIIWVIDGVC